MTKIIDEKTYYHALGIYIVAVVRQREVDKLEAEINELLGLDDSSHVSDAIYTYENTGDPAEFKKALELSGIKKEGNTLPKAINKVPERGDMALWTPTNITTQFGDPPIKVNISRNDYGRVYFYIDDDDVERGDYECAFEVIEAAQKDEPSEVIEDAKDPEPFTDISAARKEIVRLNSVIDDQKLIMSACRSMLDTWRKVSIEWNIPSVALTAKTKGLVNDLAVYESRLADGRELLDKKRTKPILMLHHSVFGEVPVVGVEGDCIVWDDNQISRDLPPIPEYELYHYKDFDITDSLWAIIKPYLKANSADKLEYGRERIILEADMPSDFIDIVQMELDDE